jgi:two-component system, NtrC family, sensor kinase
VSAERAGLRLRLVWIILSASFATLAPLAIALLLQVKDALYARRVADARVRLEAVARSVGDRCSDADCAGQIAAAAGVRVVPFPCAASVASARENLVLCAAANGISLELREDLSGVREQLQILDARLIATVVLSLAMLSAIAIWLLERGLGRRLARIDSALESVWAEQDEPSFLPESGDSLGRVGAAVNRLARRLREERARTQSQIDELREARAEIARSERLASVGRLAAGIAHEVGNPVSALIGYAAIMRERLQKGKDVAEYAGRVEREAARIDRIVRDLLELARPQPAALSPVDLRKAVLAARAAVEPQEALRGVVIEDDLPPGLPPIAGDDHYVVQVLVNLLANAARAGASKVRLAGRTEPGSVVLQVEDDGPGIPPEALPRLFEPFFTTAGPGQGTGLGLAICHATMERFHGSITARNRDGAQGASFELRFRSME